MCFIADFIFISMACELPFRLLRLLLGKLLDARFRCLRFKE